MVIRPVLAGDITLADATTESPYGPIRSRWKKARGRLWLASPACWQQHQRFVMELPEAESLGPNGLPPAWITEHGSANGRPRAPLGCL